MKKEVKNIMGLPLPRLELRWVKTGATWSERDCVYEMVIPLRSLDVRREDENCKQVRSTLRIEMGRTKVTGGTHNDQPPIYEGKVDAPFRDGSHAQWDADVLGLTVWSTCEESFSRLYPKIVEDNPPSKKQGEKNERHK